MAASITRYARSNRNAWVAGLSGTHQLMDHVENFVAGRPSNLVRGAF